MMLTMILTISLMFFSTTEIMNCIVTLEKFQYNLLEHYIVALEMSSGVMKILSQLLLKMAETAKSSCMPLASR